MKGEVGRWRWKGDLGSASVAAGDAGCITWTCSSCPCTEGLLPLKPT